MTPEDEVLDPAFFLNQRSLTLYRLAKSKYANLSGVGAATAPGRWNRFYQEAIYTSTQIAVPLLEKLVHTPKNRIPTNLAMMRIQVNGNWELHKNALIDGETSGCFWFYRSIGDAHRSFHAGPAVFAAGINPFAVAVPSVIVPVWNVVLYPQAPGFWSHVSVQNVERFEFDPRLFPDSAKPE